jgi:hypothetical protein
VQRYANVSGQKQIPFPKGGGWCHSCSGVLIAKCDEIYAHNWAHDQRDDSDSRWEPISSWHLRWQGSVSLDSVEVAKDQHRADLIGIRGIRTEMHYSSISADDIAAGIVYYGEIVCLVDATGRFDFAESGGRAPAKSKGLAAPRA